MTTLSKDEILRLAREAGMPVTDYGSGPFIDDGVTTMHIEKLYTLCRADLVAEVERLKAQNNTLAQTYKDECEDHERVTDALKADAERMRKALEKIRDNCFSEWVEGIAIEGLDMKRGELND